MNHSREVGATRRGYTLLETVLVLTFSSTLLVLAAGWIHQSMKLGSLIRDRQHQHGAALRVARQFRDDVHRATAATTSSPLAIELTDTSKQRVVYRIDSNVIHRTAFSAGSSKPESVDKFVLGERLSAVFSFDESEQWVSLVSSPGQLQVRAKLARHRRLIAKGEAE